MLDTKSAREIAAIRPLTHGFSMEPLEGRQMLCVSPVHVHPPVHHHHHHDHHHHPAINFPSVVGTWSGSYQSSDGQSGGTFILTVDVQTGVGATGTLNFSDANGTTMLAAVLTFTSSTAFTLVAKTAAGAPASIAFNFTGTVAAGATSAAGSYSSADAGVSMAGTSALTKLF